MPPTNAFTVAVEVSKEKRGERERGEQPCKQGSLDSTTHVLQCQLNPFLSCHHLYSWIIFGAKCPHTKAIKYELREASINCSRHQS